MAQEEPKGWVVWGVGKRAPVKVHPSLKDAHDEALRLSMKERGTRFMVAELIGGFFCVPDKKTIDAKPKRTEPYKRRDKKLRDLDTKRSCVASPGPEHS